MSPDKVERDQFLGFLALFETSGNEGYLGAILVTNNQGVPQEFRCTHPVKPTNIQKPLYGDTLELYIGITLCGTPLIESLQNKPSLLVVNKESLLDVRRASPCPVIFIRRAGEAIEVKSSDSSGPTLQRARVDCPSGRFQPIVFVPNPDYPDDLAPARETLESIFGYLDPIEPFERMAKAIQVLARQDKRFQ